MLSTCQCSATYLPSISNEVIGAVSTPPLPPLTEPERSAISAVCVTPTDWEVGKVDPGFVGGNLLIEDCAFVRPTGPVLDLTTGRDVLFRRATVDLRGVDTNKWRSAGAILTNGAENVHVEDVRLSSCR